MRNKNPRFDWKLIIPAILIVLMGLTVLFSINPLFFKNQFLAFLLSIAVFLVFSQISYHDFRPLAVPIYIVSVVLLIIVFIIGFESRGAVRWVDIFGTSLQASEIVKPLMSLVLAAILAGSSNKKSKSYIVALLCMAPVFILIYFQPDLGSALLFAGVSMITLIVYGLSYLWILISLIPVIIAVPFIWGHLFDYQKLRIMTFIDPLMDPSGSSYNLIQAIIAVGSGGVFGKGISEGTQSRLKFLPENHTDFIFASLSEKLGFLGSIILISLFIYLLYRVYVIYSRTSDTFGQIFCICSFLFIIIQFFVNIGMNLGLVPIVGITLPFVSYGGSSLLSNFIILGILSSISTRNRKTNLLEIK